MANNLGVKTGTDATVKTTDSDGVHTPHHNVDACALPTGAATAAKQPALGTAGTPSTDVLTIQGSSSGTAVPVSLAAAETHVGEVGSPGAVLDVTLVLDTAVYANGDVLADTAAVANAVRVNGGRAILQSVHVLDEDNQGVGFDIIFFDANNSLGTFNAAPTISDTNARAILGSVSIAASDYMSLGGCRVATKAGVGLLLKAGAATTSLYIAAISRLGTPTYTASGLKLKLGMLWD
jgi:hypothetical protein